MHPIALALGLAVTLTSLTACDRQPELHIRENPEFAASASEVPTLPVSVDGRNWNIKVYGLEGAMEIAQHADWNGILTINLMTPNGFSEYRHFPTYQQHLTINYDLAQTAAEMDAQQSRISHTQGFAIVNLAPPPFFGSDGETSDFYGEAGLFAVNGAIDQLVEDTGATSVILSGASSTGNMVAGLLNYRADVKCAIISSAPLDLIAHSAFNRHHWHWMGADPAFNPAANIANVRTDPDRTIYIGYSETDQIVDASYQIAYGQALQAAGHTTVLTAATPVDRWGHSLAVWNWRRRIECATGRVLTGPE